MSDYSSSNVNGRGSRSWLPRASVPTLPRIAFFALFSAVAVGLFRHGCTLPRTPFWRKATFIGGGSLLFVTGASFLCLSYKKGIIPLAPEVEVMRGELRECALSPESDKEQSAYIRVNVDRLTRPEQVVLYRAIAPIFGKARALQLSLSLTGLGPSLLLHQHYTRGQLAELWEACAKDETALRLLSGLQWIDLSNAKLSAKDVVALDRLIASAPRLRGFKANSIEVPPSEDQPTHPYLAHISAGCTLELRNITLGQGDAPFLATLLIAPDQIWLTGATMSPKCRRAFIGSLATTQAKRLNIDVQDLLSLDECLDMGASLARRSIAAPLELQLGHFVFAKRSKFNEGFMGPRWMSKDPLPNHGHGEMVKQPLWKEGLAISVTLSYSTEFSFTFVN